MSLARNRDTLTISQLRRVRGLSSADGICVYVCVCVCVCVYNIYMYNVCVCVCVCVCVYVCTYCVLISPPIYIYIYIYIYIHTYIHTYIYTYKYVHTYRHICCTPHGTSAIHTRPKLRKKFDRFRIFLPMKDHGTPMSLVPKP